MPLNAEGQAEPKVFAELCKDLPLTKVYSSPLIRAAAVSFAHVEASPYL